MRAYGRWQGYAWSVVVVASGTAYALSLGLRRESGRRANDVDDGGGGGGRGFDSIRFPTLSVAPMRFPLQRARDVMNNACMDACVHVWMHG